MADNDFRFDAVAGLKETESQKQVKKDIKSFLSNIKIPLIGTLSSKTKAQLVKDIASLNGTVDLTGKVNSKSVSTSLQQATAQAQKQVNAKPIEVSFAVKKEKLVNDIKLLAQQNSKLFKDTDMSIKYNSLLDDASMARNSVELSALRTQLGSLRSELKITGNAGLTFGDSLKKSLSKVMGLFGNFNIIMQFRQQLHNAWIEAEELDKSMTDLSRVNAEITRSGFPDYLDKVISKTKQLAVATKDYIDSVTTFSRAGYNLADSETLADAAVQLEKVGDMSAVDASKALLAGLQGYAEIGGYGMDQLAEKAQALNDRIDKIGNTASISQEEVARGIQAVGSVMSDANTSVDEFIALLGAGNRAVQDSDKVALAIRTSALRIRSATADLEEMGETTDGVIESTAKLAEKIKALTDINGNGGVSILEEDEETFRSIYDIYNDISKVYDKMSDKNASALLDLIAGKNRSNQISAILQNMSEANELLEKSLNAAGTASAEYEIYLDSAQAASERFGVAMTESYSSIISGDTVKGLANTGAAVLDFANSWNILEGTLKGFLTLGVLKGITTLTVAFKNSALQISNYGNALDAVKQVSSLAKDTTEYADAMKMLKSSCVNLTDAQLKQVLANRNLSDAQLIEILQLKKLEEEERNARLAQLGLIQTTETQTVAQGAATVSTFSLSAAIKGLGASIKAAFMANPIGVTIMGISLAFSVISTVISKYKESVVEADEATKEAIETFESISSEVETLEDKLSELNDQINQLDPITDAEDIENLQLETEELEKQLAILKEKQRIAGAEADKAAQKSLGMTEASRYKTEERESAYGGVETGAAYVTKDEELLNAIEAYDEYKAKVDEANDSLANMAETGEYTEKEWEEQEQIVSKYSDKMDDARAHANELAVSLDEQKQGLDGNTDASQTLLTKIDNVITKYDQWLNLINGTTEALEEQEEAEKEVTNESPDTFGAQLIASQEALDKFKSSVQSAKDAYTTLLSGNYSSSDLLDSIQTINQAVSDMGGSLNWEFINSQTDSLELLGDAIQHISQKYAESILSGAGIDINSEFGQMLADMIIQAFEAEAAFEGMNSQLDNLQSSYQTLTGILESYNETGYISLDNLQSLLTADENLIAMLEVENGQLAINQEAYENLVAVQLLEFKAKLNDAAASEIETLAKQKAEQATNQNADASQNAVEKLDAETQAFNRNTSAAIANAVAKAEESGVSEEEIQDIFNKYNEVWNAAVNNFSGDFDGFMGGGKSAASKSGKEAGDAYVDAFEKEYNHLKDMLNRGEISEAQYLSKLRALYTKYFKDRKKYLDEFKKYESEYLSGMLDLHNKALSGISTLLNRKINAANDAKDAAISALEEEKEKAEEAYQAQSDAIEKEKDAIDDLIDEKNKKIDAINEEIDAIERAAETRKKNIQLEKDQYNLEKMLNNRSSMVYKDGQFVWDTDTRGIRDAREKVREDQEALRIDGLKNEISLIQKEIDLLEEKKDSLSEEQDRIQKLMDESNKYYDNLIKQQEKMWDSMIKGMEQQKSRWEELAEVKEIAEAFSAIQQVFGDLGYTVEDVLNGSDAAFEDFKAQYISLISDVNNNSDFTEGLVYATGIAKENLGSFLDKTKETSEGLDELGEKGSEMDSVAEGMDRLSESATSASSTTGVVATNVSTVVDCLNQMPESGKVSGLSKEFDTLGESIGKVAETLGISEGETVGTLFQAMSDLNNVTLGNEGEGIIGQFTLLKQAILDVIETVGSSESQTVGNLMSAIAQLNSITLDESIIAQFTNLKEAIDSVTAAISGGGGESSEGDGSGGGSSSKGGKGSEGQGKGESGGGGNSLTGAIKEMGETAQEVIGEPDAEGDGTVIGEFGSMETAVNDVRDAIGSGESEGGEGGSGGDGDDTLVGSIEYLGDKTEEEMGESDGDGIIGKFNEFKGVIEEAANHVKSISEGLDEIDGKEVECTITINVKMNGAPTAFASGTVLGNMQIESATYNAQYGKAFASGTIGLKHAEKNALRSEYGQPELTVYPNGTTELTTSPVMSDLPKGTVIYNEEQTKKIMDNKAGSVGNAHSEGTTDISFEPYDPDKDDSDFSKFYKAWNAYYGDVNKNVGEINKKLSQHLVIEHNQKMNKEVDQFISNSRSVVNNTRNVQQPVINGGINITCPGVTSKEVAQQVGVEVGRIFNGMHLEAEQRSRMR